MKTITLTAAILFTAVAANAHEAPTPEQLSATAFAAHNAETGPVHELTREEMAKRIQDLMAAETAGMTDTATHAAKAQAMAENMMVHGTAMAADAMDTARATAAQGGMGGGKGGSMGGNGGGMGGMGN
ncbi:MAG: hypothetical protein GXP03_08560 [Alphaproteobacteria bacterium]|nr:hypothetical protein [Alphaproteobacteria bacterium]